MPTGLYMGQVALEDYDANAQKATLHLFLY
jgi:hypothetical protein